MSAVLPFQIYTIILIHRVAEYGMIMRSAGKPEILIKTSLFLLFSNVIFSIPLTFYFGMVGAALGSLLAMAVNWIYFMLKIADVFDSKFKNSFPYSDYLGSLSLCLVAMFFCVWGESFFASGGSLGIRLLIKSFSFGILVGPLLYLYRKITKNGWNSSEWLYKRGGQ